MTCHDSDGHRWFLRVVMFHVCLIHFGSKVSKETTMWSRIELIAVYDNLLTYVRMLFFSNSMNGWPAKQGRSHGAHRGPLKRKTMGSALKRNFWLLSRKG